MMIATLSNRLDIPADLAKHTDCEQTTHAERPRALCAPFDAVDQREQRVHAQKPRALCALCAPYVRPLRPFEAQATVSDAHESSWLNEWACRLQIHWPLNQSQTPIIGHDHLPLMVTISRAGTRSGERGRGPRQKLPSAAIYCHLSPQNHYDRYNTRPSRALLNEHQRIQIAV
jgi:hypothetical protein